MTSTKTAVYDVSFQFSFVGDINDEYEISVWTNGVEYKSIECQRTMGGTAQIGSCSASGLVTLPSGSVAAVRVINNSAGGTFNTTHSQFKIREVR
jgi:hypothetical protein